MENGLKVNRERIFEKHARKLHNPACIACGGGKHNNNNNKNNNNDDRQAIHREPLYGLYSRYIYAVSANSSPGKACWVLSIQGNSMQKKKIKKMIHNDFTR